MGKVVGYCRVKQNEWPGGGGRGMIRNRYRKINKIEGCLKIKATEERGRRTTGKQVMGEIKFC